MSNILRPLFVTTPIFYVNAAPHIGHLYSALVTDAIFRFENLVNPQNKTRIFTTGTDEHGIKIQQAAQKADTNVASYCDNISERYRNLFQQFQIGHTDFIRTTEKRHEIAVQHFWGRLNDNGFIYKKEYAGYYCVPDETFLTEAQLTTNPKTGEKVSSESGHPVEWTKEENYMFKLGSMQQDILRWLKDGDRIKPKKFEKILMDFLDDPLPDISVSRPASRVNWGVTVPRDDSHTVYVWLNALVNYLTCVGYPEAVSEWPPTLQVIGKDILKFHGIYWPAFLMAAGLEPPKQLLCHSHWTVDGQKMSKSKLNVVDPSEQANVYTADGMRYFLLREAVLHSDGNYSDTKVKRVINSELADTFGNLLSRCCAKTLNPDQKYPSFKEEDMQRITANDTTKKLLESFESLAPRCYTHYKDFGFHAVADTIMSHLHLTNNFFETLKPWEMKKDATRRGELDAILLLTMESLRVSSIILQPFVPRLCGQLLGKLNVRNEERSWSFSETFSWTKSNSFKGWALNDNVSPLLFKRIQ